MLGGDDAVADRIKAHRKFLLEFVAQDPRAQRYLIGGWEKAVEARPALLLRTVAALHALYEADVLEEEAVLAWCEKVCGKL